MMRFGLLSKETESTPLTTKPPLAPVFTTDQPVASLQAAPDNAVRTAQGAVHALDVDGVVAAAGIDRVNAGVGGDVVDVRAVAAENQVVAGAAFDGVDAGAAADRVIAVATL